MDRVGVERVLVIARELGSAGRRTDAELLARLAAEAGADLEIDLRPEELDRRLTDAEGEIAAGRITPNQAVWDEIAAGRADRNASDHSSGA